MGNRALIKTQRVGGIGLYMHWNGGRDTIAPLLHYCKLQGYRSPEIDGYGWARLAQVVGNFFGGSTSVGIVMNYDECDDNGVYIIKDWKIVDRVVCDGFVEQDEYDFKQMLKNFDDCMPESCKLGGYLDSVEIKTADLKIGDQVWETSYDWEMSYEKWEAHEIVGFGTDKQVGYVESVKGIPYHSKYSREGYSTDEILNNYVLGEPCRIVPRKES